VSAEVYLVSPRRSRPIPVVIMTARVQPTLLSVLERLPCDPAIAPDPVDAAIRQFAPLLVADRLRREHNSPIAFTRVVMDMRKPANFAIVQAIAFYKMERPAQSGANQLVSIGHDQVEANACGRIDFAAALDNPLRNFVQALKRGTFRMLELSCSDQMKHMFAVGLSRYQLTSFAGYLIQQSGSQQFKIWDCAIVSECPALIAKGVRVGNCWLAYGCAPHMPQNLTRINTRRRSPKMLAMKSGPGLLLDMWLSILKCRNAPAIGVAFAHTVTLALHYQRVLRVNKRAFDLRRFGRKKSVKPAHRRVFVPARVPADIRNVPEAYQ